MNMGTNSLYFLIQKTDINVNVMQNCGCEKSFAGEIYSDGESILRQKKSIRI